MSPSLRFHDLRHTAVALAIAQGAHPKALQERMGHSSVQVTLDRYGHLFPGLDERIADGLDALYRQTNADYSRTNRGLGKPKTSSEGVKLQVRAWALRDSNPRPLPCKGSALAS